MVEEADIEDLFTKPPREFIAARDALAKKAKAADRTDLAIRISALRKPTATVWLVNQIARRHPREVGDLLEAAKRLREAQTRGHGAESLHAASRAWRDAVKGLLKRGREIAAGPRQAVDDSRVAATLFGASVQPEHAKRLERGSLVGEVDPPDIERVLEMAGKGASVRAVKPAAAVPKTRSGKNDSEKIRVRDERKRKRQQARELVELRREAAKAAKAAERAELDARALERKAEEAAANATRARATADELRSHALKLRARLDEAAR